MTDELSAMARKLLAENYRDGKRAIEWFTFGIIDYSPDADLARAMSHIARSNAGSGAIRTKMNQALLRKLQLAVHGKHARRRAQAA